MPPADVVHFLREFYTAERAFLEREQLYGKARADKFAQPGQGGRVKSDKSGADDSEGNSRADEK